MRTLVHGASAVHCCLVSTEVKRPFAEGEQELTRHYPDTSDPRIPLHLIRNHQLISPIRVSRFSKSVHSSRYVSSPFSTNTPRPPSLSVEANVRHAIFCCSRQGCALLKSKHLVWLHRPIHLRVNLPTRVTRLNVHCVLALILICHIAVTLKS
jgi:hypothetical protein